MYESVVDTKLFKDVLRDEHKSMVEKQFTERTYPNGQIIYFHGDVGDRLFIIKSGKVKIFRQSDEQEIVLGHQFAGEAVGELEMLHYDKTRTASVAAIEETVLWSLARDEFLELTRLYPELMRKTIYILSERLVQANRKLEYLAFLDIRVRVANLLLDLHTNFGKQTTHGDLIDWKITQQHFANMIGCSRESSSRILHELQDGGILFLKNRYIYIVDMDELKLLAGWQEDSPQSRHWHKHYNS
ncbi:Crp/Fnr family transcriptional regulator [Aureibacillus halotolerans]|uniref:CRP/FNR family transcriptional regulator n=1 Tax=Aureibacillus halotolerans TaxID=1508390 RepID=A0A4R6U017_9BACI|nr:Crp/Fnr family transcriptional regulator [Aureibacillus halotolerans]TDQ37669.1 CRP/FNR family transcriptional regulator [Aureibacillus halotolerans]